MNDAKKPTPMEVAEGRFSGRCQDSTWNTGRPSWMTRGSRPFLSKTKLLVGIGVAAALQSSTMHADVDEIGHRRRDQRGRDRRGDPRLAPDENGHGQ
ncbi:MAG: hypothetical protein MZV63_25980 [Marinilabiliales bacterium]|nr:hypothetical protein [Marinilabiliales bacterium]